MQPIFAIPTANPRQCSESFAAWRAMGYRTVALIDGDTRHEQIENAESVIHVPVYRGWAWAVNYLCSVLNYEWLVTGGDDTWPDPVKRADEIAAECTIHFGGSTFGVMQPTGDPWAPDGEIRAAERVCGSPWIGWEFAWRWNGGKGPLVEEYGHFFADEELQLTAQAAGRLWQRRDLTHEHRHWSRAGGERPAYLARAAAGHGRDQEIFETRRRAGFPGHNPTGDRS